MDEHLGYSKHDSAGRNGGNSRNGSRSKTVLTEVGPVEVAVPRDRDGSFEPATVRKRQRAARRVVENRRAFRKMVRWRTGCEGRISCAKRDFGLNRTRIDGLGGARTRCGHGIFAHNLVKISGLLEGPDKHTIEPGDPPGEPSRLNTQMPSVRRLTPPSSSGRSS